mmetsp:Transcript_71432/g.213097  ORF Transcript_71432/g.213097 Transcript_71432/m.213097 type:complete len:114 (+) Transcript_71432:842-1183(+)
MWKTSCSMVLSSSLKAAKRRDSTTSRLGLRFKASRSPSWIVSGSGTTLGLLRLMLARDLFRVAEYSLRPRAETAPREGLKLFLSALPRLKETLFLSRSRDLGDVGESCVEVEL